MTKEIQIQRENGEPVNGETDYKRLENMTEDEIEENAKNDPDAPLLSDEDLKKFKRVIPNKE